MKNITGNKIAIAAGVVLLTLATWFASRPPSAASLPMATMAEAPTSSPSSSATDTASTVNIKTSGAVRLAPAKHPVIINIVSPTSSTQWLIGTQNTIAWNKAAGVIGQIYLVNAESGAIAGWIQQNIGPAQTYFPWNTRDLLLNESSALAKDVLPGEYIIKIAFASPNVPTVTSAPFFIEEPAQ